MLVDQVTGVRIYSVARRYVCVCVWVGGGGVVCARALWLQLGLL